ncbi:ABC transporter ATP-binding protein [Flavilitoribacter nigricans]|uniref:ATP-binding protein n=1 Tax=Flavilitoribacter nigricans (strain ATCC 23147 / DSM 23189 / NBRC 102662 / NCIMB 1420 / SS-2) TaxID=1122177 RepID=A0A2D0N4J9_FLAN2|nr:ABC transporter ATP-binding protein [Flavilitoribacter nigricans]PHN03320.1 ATP-binding protein [Flavilitoribacter nigricans DSM 23189 = NBRC 102662]
MIDVDQLRFAYPGKSDLTVKDISFHIAAGESFGFLGPSGAGKSTTQKILIRLLHNFSGNVRVMDRPIQNWDKQFYNHIGVGFELPNHFGKLTALENLQFFGAFYKRPVRDYRQSLEMVGLEEDAGKRVSDFSKGMKMRLNFVRALQHDPEILFFDEPTSGLDPANARIMKDIILQEKARGKTLFITTHNMHDAEELCDRVAFIVDGEIRLIDAPKALKLKHGQRRVRIEYTNEKPQTKIFPLDGLGQNPEFLRILQEEQLETIHSEEASLEDIFIQVTGTRLR